MRYLDDIDGLGPKSKELLEKLNIYSVEDLISYYLESIMLLEELIWIYRR